MAVSPQAKEASSAEEADQRSNAAAAALINKARSSAQQAQKAWDLALAGAMPNNDVLAATFEQLHEQKAYDFCVEGLLSAIRNDLAQPWMYDVLVIEMSLANRPQKEIDRAVLSRVDFTGSNEPQMLLTASMLSRFGAYDRAMELFKELLKRNPNQTAAWGLARSVADRSRSPEHIAWSRTGTLEYDWAAQHEVIHAEARTVLQELAESLEQKQDATAAASVRRRLQQASVRDLRIRITWAGDADLDLEVQEPGGTFCSYKQPQTTAGGRLILQSFGKTTDTRSTKHSEEYVSVTAPSGDYTVTVRNLLGRLILGKVLVTVTRHEGTDAEHTENRFYELGKQDLKIRVPLDRGRASANP